MGKNNNSFDSAKKKLELEENAYKVYKIQSPIMKAVMGIIPVAGDFIDEKVDQKFEKYQNEKRQEFINIIASCKTLITNDMVKNEPFIINILKTVEMVERLSSNDKVQYYGNLICNGYFKEKKITNDLFDEYIAVLNELSYREMQYLYEFSNCVKKNQLNRTLSKEEWVDYCNHMREKYPDVNPGFMMKRLERTGFISELSVWNEMDGQTLKFINPQDKGLQDMCFKLNEEYDNFEKTVMEKYKV